MSVRDSAVNRPSPTSAAEGWAHRIDCADQLGKTHPCCVAGCTAITLEGLLACRSHWLALPQRTRYILGQAFRRHDTHPEIYADAVTLARRLLNERAAA